MVKKAKEPPPRFGKVALDSAAKKINRISGRCRHSQVPCRRVQYPSYSISLPYLPVNRLPATGLFPSNRILFPSSVFFRGCLCRFVDGLVCPADEEVEHPLSFPSSQPCRISRGLPAYPVAGCRVWRKGCSCVSFIAHLLRKSHYSSDCNEYKSMTDSASEPLIVVLKVSRVQFHLSAIPNGKEEEGEAPHADSQARRTVPRRHSVKGTEAARCGTGSGRPPDGVCFRKDALREQTPDRRRRATGAGLGLPSPRFLFAQIKLKYGSRKAESPQNSLSLPTETRCEE